MSEARSALPEPCSAQGARVAGARYVGQLPILASRAILLRHGGAREMRWWLVGAFEHYGEAVDAYSVQLCALHRGAVAVWFDGGVQCFGEVFPQ